MKDPRSKYEDYLMADQEVARLASVSVHTVKHWRAIGLLPFVKVGKSPRVWLSVFNQVFQKPESSLAENHLALKTLNLGRKL